MVHYNKGDIFNSSADIICHQVNCQGVMGAGIAKEIRARYPKVFEDYIAYYKSCYGRAEAMLGKCVLTKTEGPHHIASIFGQEYYGFQGCFTVYPAFEQGFYNLIDLIQLDPSLYKTKSIAVPYGIGCGLAGGDWNIIEKILKEIFDRAEIDCEIWKL